jgi:plastocyanin
MKPLRTAIAFGAIALVGAVLSACGGGSGGSGSGGSSGETVQVISTNTECTPAKTTLNAGKVTFELVNKGDKATELYVYGTGDKIITEVENVGPGTTRRLTADLKEGVYDLVCKPGQAGSGIRTPIHVHGAGGTASAGTSAYDREVDFAAVDYSFDLADPHIKNGEAIEFKMTNNGQKPHEFEVVDSTGSIAGVIHSTDPGKMGETVIKFTKPGTYVYRCDLEDHLTRGMKGTITVSA